MDFDEKPIKNAKMQRQSDFNPYLEDQNTDSAPETNKDSDSKKESSAATTVINNSSARILSKASLVGS